MRRRKTVRGQTTSCTFSFCFQIGVVMLRLMQSSIFCLPRHNRVFISSTLGCLSAPRPSTTSTPVRGGGNCAFNKIAIRMIRACRLFDSYVVTCLSSFSERDAPKDGGNRPGATIPVRIPPARRRLQKGN